MSKPLRVFFAHEHPFFGSLKVSAEVTPGRPAPSCPNPSSPAYSDPGDPPDIEITSVFWGDHDITETLTNLIYTLEEEAFAEAEKLWASSSEDYLP